MSIVHPSIVPAQGQSGPVSLFLVESGAVTAEAFERASRAAAEAGESVEATLVKLGLVCERDLAAAFCRTLGLPMAGASELAGEDPALPGVSPRFLRLFRVMPIEVGDRAVRLAMANPTDEYGAQAIALFAERPVERVVATASDIDAALDRLHVDNGTAEPGDMSASGADVERLRDLASDAPVVRLVNQLIVRAVEMRASDLHLEPMPDRLVVRYRIDGLMREVEAPPLRLRDAVVSRIKIMAKLNIAEQRLPQDGRMSHAVRGTEIDFRVATVPTVHGESVVIRVLDRDQVSLDFDALGFDAVALEAWRRALSLPHGILLVTGPTGSGKTTTLYASLATLNTPERKIMTIEDPVEYQLERVNQVQVQGQIGLTFARALRAFLRQNPNIVMVGEIRDLETAQIAVQAALTGHMILSTLHTNDAASGITRLLDMGVEDYLLVSTVNAIMAQRLVRQLCPACRTPEAISAELAASLGLAGRGPVTLHRPVGCPACDGAGFKGRTTIIEILPMTETIRRLVLARAASGEIAQAAVSEGMRTLQEHGIQKVFQGITTIDEVLRVTRE